MKRWMTYMLLAVSISGCASPTRYYRWSSDAGKRCFNTCESNLYACASGCGGEQ
ncbi:lipoprotein, putative [Citrifermentans bemidjiense Bem]|uniref:Lipoprotein, putative n=1 Tax=Citrifermentans bemidjiense (strain ATCC BAA-1014 / DSM 16622 / JCM 12645 / Bem) TaxID=404380 RepID=E1P6C2_CITBB|nr:lipoprotein, putative [Citrifermentans bemidjiense Bem]